MPKPFKDKFILVIDDDAGMLRALSKVLSSEGADVTCADSAVEAIEILSKRDKRFDLVTTDLRMPFVNGVTVVYAIHEVFPELPVIVLTAYASPEARNTCLEQGAVAFLEKPLDSQELIEAICRIMRIELPKPKGSRPPIAKTSGEAGQDKVQKRATLLRAKPGQPKN